MLEQTGGAMHFFDQEYLADLLKLWRHVNLAHIEVLDDRTGEPFKRVWRGIVVR